MKKETPSIKEIVEYGLESIELNKIIQVNLRDLIYIYKSVEELIRFFHQDSHYQTLEDVKNYIGDKDNGAFSILSHIYYDIFTKMLPNDVKEIVEDDDFSHPEKPFYYKK